MPDIEKSVMKEAVKEAIQEWLDKQFTKFGRWTFTGFMAAAFAGLVYLMLVGAGWHK